MSVLETHGLTKTFGGVRASDDVSIDVREGEIHAIIGPNGAGKTTLVSQLSGNLKPDAGTVLFKGRDITALPVHRRARLGLARSFQITSLVMSMTVLDNVALAIQACEGHSFRFLAPARKAKTLRDPAGDLLNLIGLQDRSDTIVSVLSHGERRQLEIAVALAGNPSLMLLDEPMAGMGTSESERMVKTLTEIKGTKSILLVEHDMDVVFALADRISVLVYGRIIATGPPDEIRGNEDVRRAYLGEA